MTLVYCAAGEYDEIDGVKHFIPSIVYDGEKGHRPMRGQSKGMLPYYWGNTMAECQKVCDKHNEDMGVDRKTALKIIGQSMR
jgi:hypothetical protein